MAQFLRPSSDITAAGWTREDDSGTNLYQSIDEVTPSDADYIQSPDSPAGEECIVALSSVNDPGVSTGHIVRHRIRKNTDAQTNMTVRLLQGGTEIASWTYTNISDTWADKEETLSGAQADAITDYGALRKAFSAIQV